MSDSQRFASRDAVLMTAAALLLRLAALAFAFGFADLSLAGYTDKGDGQSYKRYAALLLGRAGEGELTDYDRRVFPGYPLLIAAAALPGVPVGVAALAVTVASAAAVPALAAALFRDRRVGWACVALVPHWPINSSLAMSEAPVVALSLAGLLLATRGRATPVIVGGLLLGLAGLVRPMACFAVAGLLAWAARERRWATAAAVAGLALAVVALGLLGVRALFGDALHGAKVYATHPGAYRGELFAPPFTSLVRTPLREGATLGRVAWTYAHVAATLLAVAVLARAARHDRLALLALPWLAGNTLFVLCVGSDWGFLHFPRLGLPALPALAFGLRRWLPGDGRVWVVVTAVMVPVAAWGARASP